MGVSTSQTDRHRLPDSPPFSTVGSLDSGSCRVLEKIWSISFSLSLMLCRLLTSSCSSFTCWHRSLITAHLPWARKPSPAAPALARGHRHTLQRRTCRASPSCWSSLWVETPDVTGIVGTAVAGDCSLVCITTIAKDMHDVLSRAGGPFCTNYSTKCCIHCLLLLAALVLAYILEMYMWGQTAKHHHTEWWEENEHH